MTNLPYSRRALEPVLFFSNQISISGLSATGTSSLLEEFQRRFGTKLPYRYISVGANMRAIARSLGMSIEQLAELNLREPERGYDEQCDQEVRIFGCHNYGVAEGRLVAVFWPHSFKVHLVCDFSERVRRRCQDKPGWIPVDIAEILTIRDQADCSRYERMYPGCLWPEADFDLVIDTTRLTIQQTADQVLDEHRGWLGALPVNRIVNGPCLP